MLCEKCKKNEAKFHFTQIINGYKSQTYLCENCAMQSGEGDFDFAHDFKLFFPEGFGISGYTGGSYAGITERCPKCGLTYETFTKTGKFGCAECYTAFENKIKPLLKRIHGNTVHVGKAASDTGNETNKVNEIDELKRQLNVSIANEEYEKAAVIRDKIREMEG